MSNRKAVIIGAGPGGLTAAFEFLKRTSITPVVLEQSTEMGGISRTVNYKGNRIDIGGHRFFSKSDRVMRWWIDVLPLEEYAPESFDIAYQGRETRVTARDSLRVNPDRDDQVMLVRERKSRIYFLRKFFDYPISLSANTLINLGPWRVVRVGASYLRRAVARIKPENNLEDFLINRFGKQLYMLFFKSYTEKVWGVACHEISAEWGAQRIKGVSITKAVLHALKSVLRRKRTNDIRQKGTETSLIEQFLYPKHGPGQLWETVAKSVAERGGVIETGWTVDRIHTGDSRIKSIEAEHKETGDRRTFKGDYFFSTMPVKELIRAMDPPAPANVRQVAENLIYRDFITVGLLLKRLKLSDPKHAGLIKDNWIYVQEPDVLVGRMQIFNNWSPYMVANPDHVWIGLEYFCYETDEIWKRPDQEIIDLGIREAAKIGIIDPDDVVDATVIRVPKTYPAYFGAYSRFDEIRTYVDQFSNLFLVGRNGMHKYNNQDHSMLTAMTAVDNIIEGRTDMSNIWAVNTEMEYHETKDVPKKEASDEPVVAPVSVDAEEVISA